MKKKNLLILLLIPFLVSTMTIVTVNVTYNTVDADISFIEWSFDDIEARKVSDNLYPLSAKGVNQRHTDVGKGNELTWSVKNSDEATTAHAEITQQNGSFYLKALSDGEAVVTCSNVKGNVSRSFKLIVYTNGKPRSNFASSLVCYLLPICYAVVAILLSYEKISDTLTLLGGVGAIIVLGAFPVYYVFKNAGKLFLGLEAIN